jgi:tRNA dimethylallyltransferase
MQRSIVVILGPTGVGKTDVGVLAAEATGAEIISADSMQVYRTMDTGTAKPTPEQLARVPFHLIDVADPDEQFNAARFQTLASRAMQSIQARGKRVFIVGGTGLYIRALLSGFSLASPPTDSNVRERLQAEADSDCLNVLYERLQTIDPVAAERIHPNDAVRIIRALEVFGLTGQPISKQQSRQTFDQPVLKFGLELPRALLYERIERRVDTMLSAGFLQEVEALLAKGYPASLSSMKSLGYRHLSDYLQGKCSYEEAVDLLKRDTRRFAKRQMTWFRREPDVLWLDVRTGIEAVAHSIIKIIKQINQQGGQVNGESN